MGKTLRKIKRGAKVVVTGAATVVGTVIGMELACVGAQYAINDVMLIKDELTAKPLEVKTGWKKSTTVAKKPFSKEFVEYKGDKAPVAKISKRKFEKISGQKIR